MKGNAALDCGELRRMRTPLIYLDFLLNSARLVITLSQIPEYQQPAMFWPWMQRPCVSFSIILCFKCLINHVTLVDLVDSALLTQCCHWRIIGDAVYGVWMNYWTLRLVKHGTVWFQLQSTPSCAVLRNGNHAHCQHSYNTQIQTILYNWTLFRWEPRVRKVDVVLNTVRLVVRWQLLV